MEQTIVDMQLRMSLQACLWLEKEILWKWRNNINNRLNQQHYYLYETANMLRFICIIYAQFVSFSNVCISEASIATYLRCDGNFYTSFVENFISFLAVKCQNRLTFCKVIAKKRATFLWDTVL